MFSMKRWKWALLIFELALFAVILILPQVELPDFTFHGGTAPILAKSRLSSSPLSPVLVTPVQTKLPASLLERGPETDQLAAPSRSNSRLSELCTFLC